MGWEGGGNECVTLGETRNCKGPHTINAANVGSVHTTLEEVENGCFTLKTHQMSCRFPQRTVILDLCLNEFLDSKIHIAMLSNTVKGNKRNFFLAITLSIT